ncbi:unnamed protein product [Camellia sinensis]
MSDEGEKTCPLCAEEMDLTDQQLKPCKCGYEICVWCWHHVMDMAEKDETEGRCPACRTPYNKEKIVGMAANCERLVVEMNMERKVKPQKAKGKTSEGRKQLSSVRVIQRNLVYIVGLPLNLADEDLLQRREYFGQYGKVLKVSISRTAAGAIQHFANNTCSVYITYSKEEEAVRCIQSVHGFTLDGRSLRACFGTTKYCHAWLRNAPCSNPDCLYLHEIGTQEDSFTKDEIISAYTRSRVQQVTGAINDMQRRSGNVLPPPADEYCINSSVSSGKPISKSASNVASDWQNPASSVKGSPPNSSSGRSVALPAAASWGTRPSTNGQPPSPSLICSNGPSKQKPETCSGSVAFSTAVAGTAQVPLLHGDVGKKLVPFEGRTILHKGKQEPLEPVRQNVGTDHQTTTSEAPDTPGLPDMSTVNGQLHSPPASEDKDRCISVAPDNTNSFDLCGQSYSSGSDKDLNVSANGNIQNLCSDVASMNIDKRPMGEHYGDNRPNSLLSDNTLVNSPRNQGLQQCYTEQFREPLTAHVLGKAVASTDDIYVTRDQSDWRSDSVTREQSDLRSDSQTQVANTDSQVTFPDVEEDLQYFEDQRLKDPEVITNKSYFTHASPSFPLSNHSRVYSLKQNEPYGSTSFNLDPQMLDKKVDKGSLLHPSGVPAVRNGFPEDIVSSSVDSDRAVEYSYLLPNEVKKKHVGRFVGEAANANQNVAADMGENSIISNILSMDFDVWDESLTSPQNLAKLLGETDRQQRSLKLSNSWKAQNSSQSRFSFARQEESKNQVSDVEPSLHNIGQVLKDRPLSHGFPESRDFNFDKFGDSNGFSTFNIEESDNFANSHSYISSNKLSGALKASFMINMPRPCGKSETDVDGSLSLEKMKSNIGSSWLIWLWFGFLAHMAFCLAWAIPVMGPVQCSRAQIFAPPGFSAPTSSRAPPPGFPSHERMEPTFDAMSGNHLLDASSLLRNPYQAPLTGNIGSAGDIEFMDPAILAVGKGRLPGGLNNNAAGLDMRSNFPPQLNAFENEARLQLLMQRSLSPLQNHRFADMGDGYNTHSDAYRVPSRIMEQTLASNLSPFPQLSRQQSRPALMSNGQWDGWNEVQSGNDLGMSELLRTEILGYNKVYNGYEDSKFRMPSSGDIYNRTYGI